MRRISTSIMWLVMVCTVGCTQTRVKKYEGILEPLIGKAPKSQVNKLLGNPVSCRQEARYEKCEYRSAFSQNNPVPEIFRRVEGLGPDLSPYEYFDVLHLYFDGFHVLKEWEPVVIMQ